MIYRELPPSASVGRFVESYWYLRRRGPGGWESIYPDGSCEAIFNLGDPAEALEDGRPVRRPRHFVHGQLDRSLRVRSAQASEVLAIRLRPWGATPLLDVPGERLAGICVSLDAVAPALARELVPIVESGSPITSRVARLDAALEAWIRRAGCPLPPTAAVARRLLATPAATAGDVARLTGWSARTAQRHFRAEIGLAPKRFLQVARFLRFARWLDAEPSASLGQLAAAAGYYDQPHLHRDLRRFTGLTPARFRTRAARAFDRLYGRERLARLVAL